MPVTSKEALEYISAEITKRNGKLVPTLPKMLHKMCNDAHFYVFTVGPWGWYRQLGGRGSRTCQACAEGESFSEPLTFPVMDNETVASDMNKMENRQEDGSSVVDAFMMRGYGFTPETGLENWGFSVIEHWPPTKADLVEPNRRLNKKFDELVAEGDLHHDHRKFEDINEYHRLAARRRKLNKPWLNENPDYQSCPGCGSNVMPNIAVCPQCTAVLNEALARKIFPERFKHVA